MQGKDNEPTAEDRLNEAFIDTDEFRELFAARHKAEKAVERGEKEVSLPAVLMDRVLAITQPLDLEHLQAVYNRLCDEMGLPEEKVAVPEITVADVATGKKISVRKEPLHYKKTDKQEDSDEGPF